jgi:hypothetical protein
MIIKLGIHVDHMVHCGALMSNVSEKYLQFASTPSSTWSWSCNSSLLAALASRVDIWASVLRGNIRYGCIALCTVTRGRHEFTTTTTTTAMSRWGSSAQAAGGRSVHSWAITQHQCPVRLTALIHWDHACMQRIDRLHLRAWLQYGPRESCVHQFMCCAVYVSCMEWYHLVEAATFSHYWRKWSDIFCMPSTERLIEGRVQLSGNFFIACTNGCKLARGREAGRAHGVCASSSSKVAQHTVCLHTWLIWWWKPAAARWDFTCITTTR